MANTSLPRKIAFLLVALEAGIELKLRSGHTLAMAESDEPGFVTYTYVNDKYLPTNDLLQVGSDTAYMMLVGHAKEITDAELEDIEYRVRMKG